MGHASMDKIPPSPFSPSSPLPLPLVLFTPDCANPHLINKHQKITATRALTRVDPFDPLHKDILDKELVFSNEKAEKKVENEEEEDIDEQCDDTISFRSIRESVRRILGLGFEKANSKIGELKSLVGGKTVWSVGVVALFFGAAIYVRKRNRREKQLLMLLLEEKDQRIANMLQQIALINDIRSLTSRVPAVKK